MLFVREIQRGKEANHRYLIGYFSMVSTIYGNKFPLIYNFALIQQKNLRYYRVILLKVGDIYLIYDVAIVGAGPAGTSAAYLLEKQGYKILLLDKEIFPRSKPCAGVVSPKIYSELEIPESIKERELEGYRLFSPSGVMVESTFLRRGMTVRRDKFDFFLLKRLKTPAIKTKVSNCRLYKDFVEVISEKGSFRAKVVVGADGVNSAVRKIIDTTRDYMKKSGDIALAIQYEILLSKDQIDELFGNWFEVYYTIPYGYGWISPLKDAVKVGIGGLSDDFKRNSKNILDDFLKRKFFCKKVTGVKIGGLESHLIPMSGPLNNLTAERTILVGDAGGFVFPGTGEGIFYAIKSGRIAAEVIAQALKENKLDAEYLGFLYHEKLERHGLISLKEYDFVEKVLSSPEKAENYLKTLKKLKIT